MSIQEFLSFVDIQDYYILLTSSVEVTGNNPGIIDKHHRTEVSKAHEVFDAFYKMLQYDYIRIGNRIVDVISLYRDDHVNGCAHIKSVQRVDGELILW